MSAFVAIASFRSRDVLEDCLRSVLAQTPPDRVYVARRGSDLETLRATWPGVTFVEVQDTAGVPELRGAALAAAPEGDVLLTEDHCVVSPNWTARMTRHLERADIVGGAMGNARRDRAIDWGAFFAEYGFFGPGAGDGADAPSPTGANVAYAARLVDEVSEWYSSGLWENVVHDRLRDAGASVAFDPDAVVSQNLTYELGPFLKDRFEHGRSYGRRRLVDEPGFGRRLALLVTTPVLPFALEARVARTAGRAFPSEFRRSAPFSLSFLGAWAMGEFAGYLQGPSR